MNALDLNELKQTEQEMQSVLQLYGKSELFDIRVVQDAYPVDHYDDRAYQKLMRDSLPGISLHLRAMQTVMGQIKNLVERETQADAEPEIYADVIASLLAQQVKDDVLTTAQADEIFNKLELMQSILSHVCEKFSGGEYASALIQMTQGVLAGATVSKQKLYSLTSSDQSQGQLLCSTIADTIMRLDSPQPDPGSFLSLEMEQLLQKAVIFNESVQAANAYEAYELESLVKLLSTEKGCIAFLEKTGRKNGFCSLEELVTAIDFVHRRSLLDIVANDPQEIHLYRFITENKNLEKLLDKCRFAVHVKNILEDKKTPVENRVQNLETFLIQKNTVDLLNKHRGNIFLRGLYFCFGRLFKSRGRTKGAQVVDDQLQPRISAFKQGLFGKTDVTRSARQSDVAPHLAARPTS